MRHIILGTIVGTLLFTTSTMAQTFWGFDENNEETFIPAQCDGQFDETHGGVYMPTPDELFERGESFLLEKGSNRSNAAYCLLAAAVQGNVKAQYRVAQLYNKGLILPQNDIAAYRWAFLASLNGSKDAEQLALTLEQLLSSEEIKLATNTVEPMLPTLKQDKKDLLADQEAILAEKKAELDKINQEIDTMLGVNYQAPQIKTVEEISAEAKARVEKGTKKEDVEKDEVQSGEPKKLYRRRTTTGNQSDNPTPSTDNIFDESDRMQ